MEHLKFTGLAQVGQTIRGHDFNPLLGTPGCYLQGEVLETDCVERGCLDYKVRVTERKLEGVDQPNEIGSIGFIPHQVSLLEWDGRVELVPETADVLPTGA